MAWTAPASYSVSQIVTAVDMNLIRDNLRYLKGMDGAVAIQDALGVTVNTNAANGAIITQSNAGASAFASLYLVNDGASIGGLIRNSSGNTTYGGANALNLLTFSAHPLAFGTNNAIRQFIDTNGNVGFGTIAPQGKLHIARGASGGMVFLSGTISGTLNTLAAAGTVTVMAAFWGMIRNNGGSTLSFIGLISANLLALGGSFIVNCNTAADQVTVTVTAGGAITAQRTAGANSHELNMLVFYV